MLPLVSAEWLAVQVLQACLPRRGWRRAAWGGAAVVFALVVAAAQPPAGMPNPPPPVPQPQAIPPAPPPLPAGTAAPMDEPLRLLAEARQTFQGVRDYTCLMIKRERLHGQLQPECKVSMKVRHQPFSVYLNFL